MSRTLIGSIKRMTGDSVKFRYNGSIFPWRGRAGTVIPAWACIDILRKEGWSAFRMNPVSRLWEAVRPDGEAVAMSLRTMRWFTVHAVYDNEINRQKSVDNCQPV
jgi:hypothetical protein